MKDKQGVFLGLAGLAPQARDALRCPSGLFSGVQKRSAAAASAAMRPRRRSAFSGERLPR